MLNIVIWPGETVWKGQKNVLMEINEEEELYKKVEWINSIFKFWKLGWRKH